MQNFDRKMLAEAIERNRQRTADRMKRIVEHRILHDPIDETPFNPIVGAGMATCTTATTSVTWDNGNQDIVKQVRESIQRIRNEVGIARDKAEFNAVITTRDGLRVLMEKTAASVASPTGFGDMQIYSSFLGFPLMVLPNNERATEEAWLQAMKTKRRFLLILVDGDSLDAKIINGAAISSAYGPDPSSIRNAEIPEIRDSGLSRLPVS